MKKKNNKKVAFVLVYLIKGGMVCLARKAYKIGKDCLNGYGGEIERGESKEEAVTRELKKESWAEANSGDLQEAGELKITRGRKVLRVYIFILKKWKGRPKTTKEMRNPTWFPIKDLPFEQMMPGDDVWLPEIFEGWKIIARIKYGSRGQMEACNVTYNSKDR